MKICFLTIRDPEDIKSWSGIFYQMYYHLKKDNEVEWIGHVQFKKWQDLILKGHSLYYRFSRRKKSLENAFFSYCYAENVSKKLSKKKYDIIFAPVSSSLITSLDTSIPIVYLSDATFEIMIDYYPQFTGLSKRQINEANKIETRTLARVNRAIYSSEWARDSAIKFYKADAEKVFFFEMGANLLQTPSFEELDFSDSEVCNIVFIGMDWIRKGGDKAYQAFRYLKNKGFKCTFTIIGCNPILEQEDSIVIIPFLNKNNKEDFKIFFKILQESHILLLPSKAECFGIVFAEASAFGIPSFATKTGGIPSAVKDGANGFLLDIHAEPKDFADKIYSIFTNKEEYKKLRLSTRKEYEKRLNWNVWTENFNNCIKNLI
jgi:glycosyltransferase involved in cell wall biosynthesis